MSDSEVWIGIILFYGAIFAAVYVASQKKKHRSQRAFKSFMITLLPQIGVLFLWFALIATIDWLVEIPRNELLTAFFVGAIFISMIRAWRWSIATISSPIPGYKFEAPVQPLHNAENLISRKDYLIKYSLSEERLTKEISTKKLYAEVIDGQLYVEDSKPRK